MIGKLKGLVDSIAEGHVIIDVNGVGYLVFASANCLRNLPNTGEATTLYIETHVREDHIHLYGFKDAIEQECFKTLIGVNGVGTKLALTILSALTPDQLSTALVTEDVAVFKPITGVGPKLVSRLITELKDKTERLSGLSSNASVTSINTTSSGNVPKNGVMDAVSALTNLGYNKSDTYRIVSDFAAKDESISVEELIRLSLKELAA